jgi:hypothetical protein
VYGYAKGDRVSITLRTGEWCRGRFDGTVRVIFKQAIGSFSVTVS